ACIHGQINGREESEQHEGEHSARQRKWGEPARKKTGVDYPVLADVNRAGSQRAECYSLHQGRERTRNSKNLAPASLHRILLGVIFSKHKRSASKNNAQQHCREWDV